MTDCKDNSGNVSVQMLQNGMEKHTYKIKISRLPMINRGQKIVFYTVITGFDLHKSKNITREKLIGISIKGE